MRHPGGEEARIIRLRESRFKALAVYQQRQAKVTILGNKTVESLRGIETRVTHNFRETSSGGTTIVGRASRVGRVYRRASVHRHRVGQE